MKAYQKQLNLKHHAKASKCCPVLPPLSKDDVPAGEFKAFAYDNHGNYLGHADAADVKKFLLTRLYYKTKGAYSVKTRGYRGENDEKTIRLYEKNTNNLALTFECRKLNTVDIIDVDDKIEQVHYALKHEVDKFEIYSYQKGNWSVPTVDKFGLTYEIREELEQEIRLLIQAKKQKMQKYLNDIIKTDALLKNGSAECGVELDF